MYDLFKDSRESKLIGCKYDEKFEKWYPDELNCEHLTDKGFYVDTISYANTFFLKKNNILFMIYN